MHTSPSSSKQDGGISMQGYLSKGPESTGIRSPPRHHSSSASTFASHFNKYDQQPPSPGGYIDVTGSPVREHDAAAHQQRHDAATTSTSAFSNPPRATVAQTATRLEYDALSGFPRREEDPDSPARRQEAAMRQLEADMRNLGLQRGGAGGLHSPKRRGMPLQQESPPRFTDGASGHTAGTTTSAASMSELRMYAPMLSKGFACSNEDAMALMYQLSRGASSDEFGRMEDQLSKLEAENRSLTKRLESRTDEVSRVRDDLAEARGKLKAIDAQTKQTVSVLSLRRDEMRKQLLQEEGRTSKVQMQNKMLQQEVDKLKLRVHSLLGGK